MVDAFDAGFREAGGHQSKIYGESNRADFLRIFGELNSMQILAIYGPLLVRDRLREINRNGIKQDG
jgi:hypothetical protein